jgi:hypothetical protein
MHDAPRKVSPVSTDGQVDEIPAVLAARTGDVCGIGHQEWH